MSNVEHFKTLNGEHLKKVIEKLELGKKVVNLQVRDTEGKVAAKKND